MDDLTRAYLKKKGWQRSACGTYYQSRTGYLLATLILESAYFPRAIIDFHEES